MNLLERFRHDRSRYERPSSKYRCGRGAVWGKPCARGPNADGLCGGTKDCNPFLRDGRYHCTRPAWAGGPCPEGPNPDGSCAHTRPACAPVTTLRTLRARLSIAAVVLVVALIGFTMGLPRSQGPVAEGSFATAVALRAVDSGPLTSKHAASIQWHDCSSCHAAHGTGAVGWWKAAFGGTDMNAQCRACHDFGRGNAAELQKTERWPHNYASYADRQDKGPSACESCHVEHRGAHADIKHLADAQCNTCHKQQVAAFDRDHPAFRPNYPYFERTAIRFNHVTHIYDYFQRADKKTQAPDPRALCTHCHLPDYAQKATPPAGYEKACAGCHEQQIVDADIDVFVLPELPDRLRKPPTAKVKTVCGKDVGDYQTESEEALSGAAAFLLGQPAQPAIGKRPPPAQDAAAKATFDAIFGLAERGAAALNELFDNRAKDWGVKSAEYNLFGGLSLVTAQQIACDWLVKGEFETKADQNVPRGSWYADQFNLKYKPTGHADGVVRGWLELAARLDPAKFPAQDPRREALVGLRRQVLGVGAGAEKPTAGVCAKCHGLVETETGKGADGRLEVSWKFNRSIQRPFTNFTHAHHLDLVQPGAIRQPPTATAAAGADTAKEPAIGQRCAFCHVLKRNQDDYDAAFKGFNRTDPAKFTSNFTGVTKTVCQDCHSAAGFRQDCQTCHRYHLEPRTHPRTADAPPPRQATK